MDVTSILHQLKKQRDSLTAAIAALESRGRKTSYFSRKRVGPRPKRRMSAAARKRISDSAKARWAKAKKAGRNAL
jgi:hypothetical protein